MRTKSNTIGAYMRLSSSAKQCISTEREGAALRTCARLGAERGELLGRDNGASYRSSAFVLCHSKPIKPSKMHLKLPREFWMSVSASRSIKHIKRVIPLLMCSSKASR